MLILSVLRAEELAPGAGLFPLLPGPAVLLREILEVGSILIGGNV